MEIQWSEGQTKITQNNMLNKLRTVCVCVCVCVYSLLQYLLFSSALSKKGAISIHAMAPKFLQAFPQTHVLVIFTQSMWNIEEECKVVPDKDICTDTLAEKKREKKFLSQET